MLSSIIFDTLMQHPLDLTNIPISQKQAVIQPYLGILANTLSLGEQEHSGDWDPYLTYKMTNEDEFDTSPGYIHPKHIENGNMLIITGPDEDEAILLIEEIQSITLFR